VGSIDAPEFAKRVPERVRAILEAGSAVFETTHMRRDGIALPTEISSRVVTFQGATALLSIARDIAERKRFES
jgi:PAS domain S-box-containing protein